MTVLQPGIWCLEVEPCEAGQREELVSWDRLAVRLCHESPCDPAARRSTKQVMLVRRQRTPANMSRLRSELDVVYERALGRHRTADGPR
jgi:hypothetical protein